MNTVSNIKIKISDQDSSYFINDVLYLSNIMKVHSLAFRSETCVYFHKNESKFNEGTITVLDHLLDYEFDDLMIAIRALFNCDMLPNVQVYWTLTIGASVVCMDGSIDTTEKDMYSYISEYEAGSCLEKYNVGG